MTPASTSPALRRRVLAAELKNLRRSAGLTHVDVANRLGWQQGKVSKIESAKQGVGIEGVIALAEICHATAEHRERLIDLARAARARGWWEAYSDVLPPERRTYIGLETEADSVRSFASETIPELLQTPDYATAVLVARSSVQGVEGAERRLEMLLGRQRSLLEQKAVELDIVLAESTLRRAVGGYPVLQEQLRRLADLASRPSVTIRVLPFAAGALPAEGPFSILEFRETPHPDVVFVPSEVSCTYFEEAAAVESYGETMRALETLALSPEESVRFIDVVKQEVAA